MAREACPRFRDSRIWLALAHNPGQNVFAFPANVVDLLLLAIKNIPGFALKYGLAVS